MKGSSPFWSMANKQQDQTSHLALLESRGKFSTVTLQFFFLGEPLKQRYSPDLCVWLLFLLSALSPQGFTYSFPHSTSVLSSAEICLLFLLSNYFQHISICMGHSHLAGLVDDCSAANPFLTIG